MSTNLYTPEQWEELEPLLRRLAHGSVLMAREVMVDGLRTAEVARRHDTTRQHVGQIVRRVRKALRESDQEGMAPVVLWLPIEAANTLNGLDQDVVEALLAKLLAELGDSDS